MTSLKQEGEEKKEKITFHKYECSQVTQVSYQLRDQSLQRQEAWVLNIEEKISPAEITHQSHSSLTSSVQSPRGLVMWPLILKGSYFVTNDRPVKWGSRNILQMQIWIYTAKNSIYSQQGLRSTGHSRLPLAFPQSFWNWDPIFNRGSKFCNTWFYFFKKDKFLSSRRVQMTTISTKMLSRGKWAEVTSEVLNPRSLSF